MRDEFLFFLPRKLWSVELRLASGKRTALGTRQSGHVYQEKPVGQGSEKPRRTLSVTFEWTLVAEGARAFDPTQHWRKALGFPWGLLGTYHVLGLQQPRSGSESPGPLRLCVSGVPYPLADVPVWVWRS